MSGSVNKVIILGNCTSDPEVRNLPSGGKVVNLSVATNETWKDRNTGERKERSEFHRVVIFSEGLAKVAEQYLRKGSKVYLEGQLQTRKWQDQSGADRYATEIVLQNFNSTLTLLDKPQDSASAESPPSQPQGRYSADKSRRPAAASPAFAPDGDSDIPFSPEWRG